MENFRFRIGMFGKLILQIKVADQDNDGYKFIQWQDAKVENLKEYYENYPTPSTHGN